VNPIDQANNSSAPQSSPGETDIESIPESGMDIWRAMLAVLWFFVLLCGLFSYEVYHRLRDVGRALEGDGK